MTDPYDWDSDDDSLSDPAELENGTDPLSPDSDLDGISDGSRRRFTLQIHSTPTQMGMGY